MSRIGAFTPGTIAVAAIVFWACGDGGSTEPAPPPNRAPEAVGTIAAVTVTAGETTTVNVASAFRDPDGNPLTYTAAASDAGIAAASVSGSVVTISGMAPGTATITVTATDPGGLSAASSFAVTVFSRDRHALIALYNATDGPNWTNNTNWLTNTPLEQWYGVSVDRATGRVLAIALSDNSLEGTIPQELGALSGLVYLALDFNQLTGPIPASIWDLYSLQELYLHRNRALSGTIPPEIGNLHSLSRLRLSDNQLTGEIPSEIGNLQNLWELLLSSNQLTGELPSEIGNLSQLTSLYVDNNPLLSGPLPLSLVRIPLQQFFYYDTNLCVPADATMQAWLAAIPEHLGTGVDCGRSQVATLYLVSGGGQQGNPRQQLPDPVVVRAVDAAGGAVSGATVVFTPLLQGHGTANPTEAVTDSQGEARTVWTLGQAIGRQALTATADDIVLQITATVSGMADDHSCARGQETRLSRGDSISGELTAGDEDCFGVVVPGNATATQLAAWTTGDTDTYGYIYDSGYNLLAEDDDGVGPTTNFRAVADPALPGTYHIKVSGYDQATTGRYMLHVDDHGNSWATATDNYTVHRTDSVTVAGDLSVSYNVDYFYLGSPTEPTTVGFTTTGSTDTYGVLYDENGREVASDDDSGTGNNFRFLHQLEAGVDYYLRVTGFDNSTGPYQLHLWLPQTNTGATRLTNHSGYDGVPAWSPDGSRIAFMSSRAGNEEIYAMNADGSGVTRLTNHSAEDVLPAWSPDGSRIAFTSDRDGNYNYEIYLMNTNGSGVTRLTNHADADAFSAWSPDGRRIAFASERDGDYEIYVMNADGSGTARLTNQAGDDWFPTWSPDGRRIAFASERDGDFEIYVMNANGSGVVRLTNHTDANDHPAWSPDGRRIAFASERDGNFEIYMMNADGTGVARLTQRAGDDGFPAWSPDGRRIAFASDRDGNFEIYVMNVSAGSSAHAPHAGLFRPTWRQPVPKATLRHR